ncbi:hypothetical protein PV367_24705 [Streptomyces europaeiscabiei]|uniref:Uncharacterized protein n=1 Tax=Streptomyces europaeiscabiei TaxID=146819 RepID=A0AAJ2UNJ1_9ACTN|nr:hypothetical protein [Streptomyces europaeiscabiei]MDX3132901.1 hypothetical protein [Streptomyces europaeiscabiei]
MKSADEAQKTTMNGGTVELRIGVDGEGGSATLYRWLARDPDLAYQGRMSPVVTPTSPGEQGGTFEAVNVILANVAALGSLVVAVLTYRSTRRGNSSGSIRFESQGVVVTIEPGTQVSAEEIIARLSDGAGGEQETRQS